MTIRMVKSSRFGKITKQAGRNKRAGRKYFSDLLHEHAENLWAGCQKQSENLKRACSSIRDFRVCRFSHITYEEIPLVMST